MPSAVRAFSIGHVLVCSAYLQHTHIHLAFFVRLCIFSSPNAALTHESWSPNDPIKNPPTKKKKLQQSIRFVLALGATLVFRAAAKDCTMKGLGMTQYPWDRTKQT